MRGLAAVAALAALVPATPAFGQSCDLVHSQAEAAASARDQGKLRSLYEAALPCGGELRGWIGLRIASGIYAEAASGARPDEARLREALTFGRPWQVLATLGDIAFERQDFKSAAEYYQEASIQTRGPLGGGAAPKAVIDAIWQKAEIASLLSPEYVSLGGRPIDIVSVAMPLEFVTGAAQLTPKGRRAMDDLVSMLESERPRPTGITLVGHTDDTGDAAMNLALSRRRADSVALSVGGRLPWLKIDVEAKGETAPFRLDDPGRYTRDQKNQIDRRVEVVRR